MAMRTNGPAQAAGRSGALAAMNGFDYSAWTKPVDQAAYRAFVTDAKSKELEPEPGFDPAGTSQLGVGIGIGLAAFGLIPLFVGWSLHHTPGQGLIADIGLVGGALMICFGLFFVLRYGRRFLRRWRLFYRATLFARDNGLDFVVQKPMPDYDGMLFRMPGDEHEAYYVFSKPGSPVIEAGQVRHTHITNGREHATDRARSGGQQQSQSSLYGYIAIELPVRVPLRTVLRSNAKANESALTLGWAQKLGPATSLNDVYTLFSPPECADVAKQLFTKELVARIRGLEKKYSPVNAELYGNHLYVFSRKPFDMYDPTTVRLVFDTVAAAVPDPSGSSV